MIGAPGRKLRPGDDLTVTVGDAASYTPDAYAAGHTKGNKA
ncbi:hypothetical protein ACNPQM_41995 [Streptomyces sp. NPDC056231]